MFFISDLHFGHSNILKFCSQTRPFINVEEMNSNIIYKWNKTITNNDVVYLLGDVSFDSIENTNEYMEHLNRKELHLIIGNHDHKYLKDSKFRSHFKTIRDYYELYLSKKETVVLSHYPFLQWNKSHWGSYHLHGHIHSPNNDNMSCRRMDVGVDSNNLYPYHIDDIHLEMKKVPK